MPLSTLQKVTLAIGIAAAGLVAVAVMAARGTSELLDNADWVSRVGDARATLRALDNNVDHAYEDVRGFLLTGDSTYILRYRSSRDSVAGELSQLRGLANVDASVAQIVDTLRIVVADIQEELERPLAAGRDATRLRGSARIPGVDTLVARIDDARRSLDARTNTLLVQRAATQHTRAQLAWLAFFLLGAASIAVAISARRSVRRDLHRREEAEIALRASEAKFAGILDIAADGIVTVNEHQEIIHFNRGAEAIFGYAPAEVIGSPLELLLPERFAGAHRQRVERFAGSPEASQLVGARAQVIGRRRDGQEFTAEASISKLSTPDGPLFTVVLRDITERRRVERREHALAEAGRWLAIPLDYEAELAAVAGMMVGVVGRWCIVDVLEESDSGATIIRRVASVHPDPEINDRLRRIAAKGLTLDSPERVVDVFRTRSAEIVTPLADEWLEAHTSDAETLALWRDLGSRAILIVPLQAQGRLLGAMTIGSAPEESFDADDLALAVTLAERGALAIRNTLHLRRAERATAARDRVLSAVSHDLRNFLSAISMSAESLQSAPPEALADGRGAIVQNIADSAGWMRRLMQDLLDVASIEAGRLSIELDEQAVAPLIEAVREVFAEQARNDGIALHVDTLPGLPIVRADGQRIMQVLTNLVGNSIKFTAPGGGISITARNSGNEIVVAVRDTGAGIPAKDLPHIFDRFWHARRNGAASGTGLGLAIAQGIVVGHNGRIWAESEVGKGSTFSFALPIDGTNGDGHTLAFDSAVRAPA